VHAEGQANRRLDIARWIMLGAVVAPLPLLEIRSPLIGQELGESLRLTLALMGAGVALGMIGAYALRRRHAAVEFIAAVVAGVVWIAAAFVDRPVLLAGSIIIGLAAGWTAVLLAIGSGISGRGVLGAAAIVLAAILVPLAISPDRRWEPLAAACGAVAIAAAVTAAAMARRAPPQRVFPTQVRWADSIRGGVLLAVAAGVTWGTTPAVNRVTWQQFRAEEEYSSITVLGGAVFAVALAFVASSHARRNSTAPTPLMFRRETTGALISVAFVVIAIAPTLTITMIARSVALGSADLLIAGLLTQDSDGQHAAKWPFAVGGIVIGLMFSAVVTVINSIDPRAVVGFLAASVLLATAADLLAARLPQPTPTGRSVAR
jgi:hypothetical protein